MAARTREHPMPKRKSKLTKLPGKKRLSRAVHEAEGEPMKVKPMPTEKPAANDDYSGSDDRAKKDKWLASYAPIPKNVCWLNKKEYAWVKDDYCVNRLWDEPELIPRRSFYTRGMRWSQKQRKKKPTKVQPIYKSENTPEGWYGSKVPSAYDLIRNSKLIAQAIDSKEVDPNRMPICGDPAAILGKDLEKQRYHNYFRADLMRPLPLTRLAHFFTLVGVPPNDLKECRKEDAHYVAEQKRYEEALQIGTMLNPSNKKGNSRPYPRRSQLTQRQRVNAYLRLLTVFDRNDMPFKQRELARRNIWFNAFKRNQREASHLIRKYGTLTPTRPEPILSWTRDLERQRVMRAWNKRQKELNLQETRRKLHAIAENIEKAPILSDVIEEGEALLATKISNKIFEMEDVKQIIREELRSVRTANLADLSYMFGELSKSLLDNVKDTIQSSLYENKKDDSLLYTPPPPKFPADRGYRWQYMSAKPDNGIYTPHTLKV